MKHLKSFNENIEYQYDEVGPIPVKTSVELEESKEKMRKSFREDEKFNHLSDEDIIKVVDTFYKHEIKLGLLIIKD